MPPKTAPYMDPVKKQLFDPATGRPMIETQMSQDEALKMLRNAFTSAAERDVNTGDAVKFYVLSATGVKEEVLELRHD